MVKLYVDDQRAAPPDWSLARTVDEAVAVLREGQVTELSLDFDLGDPRQGTGLRVLDWLEWALDKKSVRLPQLEAHSGSPVGRRRLEARIDELIRRFGPSRQDD